MDTEMGSLALDDTLPERRETLRVDRRGAVISLLRTVREKVERSPLGRARRDKLGKLESLHEAVRRWELCPPQPEQLSAVFELLISLHEATENDAV
jgi:hypothetical protein